MREKPAGAGELNADKKKGGLGNCVPLPLFFYEMESATRTLLRCARSDDFALGKGHFLKLALATFSALWGFIRKLDGHGFHSALELEHQGLALSERLAELVEFVLSLLELSGEVFLEVFGVHGIKVGGCVLQALNCLT